MKTQSNPGPHLNTLLLMAEWCCQDKRDGIKLVNLVLV